MNIGLPCTTIQAFKHGDAKRVGNAYRITLNLLVLLLLWPKEMPKDEREEVEGQRPPTMLKSRHRLSLQLAPLK